MRDSDTSQIGGARQQQRHTRAPRLCGLSCGFVGTSPHAIFAFVILASHMPYVARLLDLGAGCLVPCLGSNHLVNAI